MKYATIIDKEQKLAPRQLALYRDFYPAFKSLVSIAEMKTGLTIIW